MKMTDEEKRFVVEEVLRAIAHITDEEYQERIWIRGAGPECQDFDEAVCHFFDLGDPLLDDYKNFGLTDAQYLLLKNFRDEYDLFCDDNDDPRDFINSPEWRKIMSRAQEVLDNFNNPQTIV